MTVVMHMYKTKIIVVTTAVRAHSSVISSLGEKLAVGSAV